MVTTTLGQIGAMTSFTPDAEGKFHLNDNWCMSDIGDPVMNLAASLTLRIVGFDPARMGTFIGRFDTDEPGDDAEPLELYVTILPEGVTEMVPSADVELLKLV